MRKLHVQFALVLATFQCLLIHVLGRFITPINNANIHLAVRNWLDDPVNAEAKFGHIKDWKTYKVTDMTGLFRYTDFNDDISGWNVSQVTSFKQLLYRNDKFNGDISKWQTNKVVDMSFAFG